MQTGAVRALAVHPLKLYFDLGLRVTINTDNRLITDTTVSKELYRVHSELGMAFSDLKSIVVAGFKSSFQPFHEKQALMRRVVAELDRYEASGNLRPPAVATLPDKSGRRARSSSDLTGEVLAEAE